jgi:hypothetical protein
MPGMNNIKAFIIYKFMILQLECTNLDSEVTVHKEQGTAFQRVSSVI